MRYVAQRIDVFVFIVSRAWSLYQETGHDAWRQGSGRCRITIGQDREIVRYVLQRRTITARHIRNKINHLHDASEQTTRNHLRKTGLGLRSCARVPKFILAHCKAPQFTSDHINLIARQWRNVLFWRVVFCLYIAVIMLVYVLSVNEMNVMVGDVLCQCEFIMAVPWWCENAF